ncbi:MAG: hypothetical protein ACD_14C00029G0001 [uncultured bacterium]|nr:MAG: hypothetical protein ACD_14C00029G0001 [uncultured bacterium]KKQ45471.1 MAG: hypothetical protein US63_C0016G0022 [Candidatus Moranbacteria bacterium GW2011_GWC2_37_8]KKQ62503.1 MAG: hypothetical protein US82_C0010G0023 [Parcubacteria group bacterium GW2011_GWC1_38_22]KKQ81081.1 MAG: hypothetical protein UT03_C0013G0013 [Candidatus Moranbacteria bacterium GW2011_GWD2_38_7]
MAKKINFRKGFTTKEVVIATGALVIVGVISFAVLSGMSSSVSLAKEAKFVSYASQMLKVIDRANALSSFNRITTPDWSCLGTYSAKPGDFCWGDENSNIINNSNADLALATIESIPKGQMSPYKLLYNRGAVFRINARNIEVKIYVGDTARTKIVCSQLNMIQDPDDNLSCILPSPILKN